MTHSDREAMCEGNMLTSGSGSRASSSRFAWKDTMAAPSDIAARASSIPRLVGFAGLL